MLMFIATEKCDTLNQSRSLQRWVSLNYQVLAGEVAQCQPNVKCCLFEERRNLGLDRATYSKTGDKRQGGLKSRPWREEKGELFLHMEVRVTCSWGWEQEVIRSQRAGISRAWSATMREDRRDGKWVLSPALFTLAQLSWVNSIHLRLSCFTYFLLTASIITVSLSDMFLQFHPILPYLPPRSLSE